MPRRIAYRAAETLALALGGLLLCPEEVHAHGEQLLTVISWFGALLVAAVHCLVWTLVRRRMQARGSRLALVASSALCAYAAYYASQLARDVHYGNPDLSEYLPALLLAVLSATGIVQVLRPRPPAGGPPN
jgi:uncharacterized membrane protein YbhN (UPF0104 family)